MVEIGVGYWGQPSKRCEWSLCFVIDPPVFNDLPGVGKVAEDMFIQAFVPAPAVE